MCKNICLYGGTFDPVHEGHIGCAKEVMENLPMDKVVFIPAGQSPFKTDKTNMFSDEQRLLILSESLKQYPWAEISDIDLKLPKPSYSWHIVEHYKKNHPDAKLFWLMGADQWDELEKWANYQYLVENVHFIVNHRGHAPQPKPGVRATFLNKSFPVSATMIRNAITNNEEIPESWLSSKVTSLIKYFK